MATKFAEGVFALRTDSTQAVQGIDSFEQRIQQLGGITKTALGALTSPVGLVSGGAVGIMSTLTSAAGDYLEKVKETNEQTQNMLNLSKTFGLTVKQFSGYRFAAIEQGADEEKLHKFLTKIQEISGSMEQLKKLGLTPDDLFGTTTDQKVRKIIDAYNKIGDTQKRARVGDEQFGTKLFSSIDPLIRLGSQGIDELLGAHPKALYNQSDAESIQKQAQRTIAREEEGKAKEAKRIANNPGRADLAEDTTVFFKKLGRSYMDAANYLYQSFYNGTTSNPSGKPLRYTGQENAKDESTAAELKKQALEAEKTAALERQKLLAEATAKYLDEAYKGLGNLRNDGGLSKGQLAYREVAKNTNVSASDLQAFKSNASLEDYVGRGVGAVSKYSDYENLTNKFKTLQHLNKIGNLSDKEFNQSVQGTFGKLIDGNRNTFVPPELQAKDRGNVADLISANARLQMAQNNKESDTDILVRIMTELKQKEEDGLVQGRDSGRVLKQILGELEKQNNGDWN